jgi:hypothetical protein
MMTTVMGHDNNRDGSSNNNDTTTVTPRHKTQHDVTTTATAAATQRNHATMATILSRARNCQFDSGYVVVLLTFSVRLTPSYDRWLAYGRTPSPRLHGLRDEKCQSDHHHPRLPPTPHLPMCHLPLHRPLHHLNDERLHVPGH